MNFVIASTVESSTIVTPINASSQPPQARNELIS